MNRVQKRTPQVEPSLRRVSYMCAAPRISTHPEAEISGPRAHILGCIQGFEANGWQVKPFIVGDRLPPKLATRKMENQLSGNAFRAFVLDTARWLLGKINAWRAWNELKGEVDWVYERLAPFAIMGRRFQKSGIPWILETHAPLFYDSKTERNTTVLSSLARNIELQAYRECDALVCISESLKEIIVKEAQIPEEKVLVVPNAVDTERFNPAQVQAKRLFETFTLGFVGRLYAWHGLEILLEALHDLHQEGLEISLVMVGDGLVRKELEETALRLGISEQIQFIGQVPWAEVPSYIAGFDLGYIGNIKMQIGKMYHSPLKLYEYMAMETPVLASAFQDAQAVLREDETGFLYDPGNKEDIKRALRKAIGKQSELKAMGKLARKEVIHKHGWSARIQIMLKELDQQILNSAQ